MTLQPDPRSLTPLGHRLLVKRYVKPEIVMGIVVPDTHREDETLSLWEFVRGTPEAFDTIGQTLDENCIVQTGPWRGVYVGTADSEDYFMLNAHEVTHVIRWS